MSLTPIETQYAGCHFRSRVEARWAVFFDAAGIKWDYEKEGFDLGSPVGYYLPDFWLPHLSMFAEVKGQEFSIPETNRCRTLARISGFPVLLLAGSPESRPFHCEMPSGMLAESSFGITDEYKFAEAVRRATSARFEHGQSPSREELQESRVERGSRRSQHSERGASAERELVRAMLFDRERIGAIAAKVSPAEFRTPVYRELYAVLLAGDAIPDGEVRKLATELNAEGSLQINADRTVDDSLATLRARTLDMRAADLDRLIPLAVGEKKDSLIAEKDAIRRELKATGRNYYRKFRRPGP